jgi:hypothetical protein
MRWYRVTKTINGRKYLYWQRTKRIGRRVKTENKYIGPAAAYATVRSSAAASPPHPIVTTPAPRTAPTFSATAPTTPEHAKDYFQPGSAIDKKKPGNIRELNRERKAILRADDFDADAFNATQDELDYANAVRKQRAAIRQARAETKHLKPANYFMARVLARLKKK